MGVLDNFSSLCVSISTNPNLGYVSKNSESGYRNPCLLSFLARSFDPCSAKIFLAWLSLWAPMRASLSSPSCGDEMGVSPLSKWKMLEFPRYEDLDKCSSAGLKPVFVYLCI